MIVRTLFLKIFLWFWLALILVVATVILVVEPPRERGRGSGSGGWPGFIDGLNELQLRGLLGVYGANGKDAFETHRRALESSLSMEIFVVGEDGAELSGRAVPQPMLAAARRRVEALRRPGPPTPEEATRVDRPERQERQERTERADRTDRGERSDRNDRNDRGERGERSGRLLVATATAPAGGELIAFGLDRRRWGGGGGGGQSSMPEPLEALSNTDFLSFSVLLRIAAILLVAGLVCWGMARYLTAPIRRLQSASRELESGDLGVRISSDLAGRRDEIGELARDFDRMARRVSTVISTQRQLLRDVSHELRSPLARLHVAVELAAEGSAPQAQNALDRVRREADRLEELISQLLALARLESGATEQERIDINLAETLRTIVDDATFEASGKGKRVELSRCDASVVHGVPTLIRSAIDNVIRNAVDFTPEDTAVEVGLEATDDGLAIITVRDRGPGVPPDALQRIFEPFFRAVTNASRPRSGTGLGLAISERAVRLHRGSIEALNADGGGLLVRIALPTKGG
jgi:two-component system sensor histidine kinase CpxA